MQQCIKILFHIYMKLNMFRATHPSDVQLLDVVRQRTLPDNVQQLHVRQPSTYAKPEAASAVLSS